MDDARASRALGQLRALLGRASLPAAKRGLGERVVARLAQPLRVCVIGYGTPFQRQIVDGFLGAAVLPAGRDLPPARVAFGDTRRILATFATGERRPTTEAEIARTDPFALAMLEIFAPLPILEKLTLLSVVLEGDPVERQRATIWAAGQADLLVWVSDAPDAGDAALWSSLPDPVRDHAFLAVPEAAGALPPGTETLFCRVCRDAADGPARLRMAVLDHVSSARREDIERALLLLEGHSETGTPPVPPARAERVMPDQAHSATQAPDTLSAPPRSEDDHRIVAQDVVRLIAHRAEAFEEAAGPETRAALTICSEALEDCAALAHEIGPVAEILDEALEMMLLLGLEGTESALTDGLALMVQVRRECAALAA